MALIAGYLHYAILALAFALMWAIILPVGFIAAVIVARQHHRRRGGLAIEGRSVVARG